MDKGKEVIDNLFSIIDSGSIINPDDSDISEDSSRISSNPNSVSVLDSTEATQYDLMVRLWGNEETTSVNVFPTEFISTALEAREKYFQTIAEAFCNCWLSYKYQQNYTAYLLGGIDDAGFAEISNSFARELGKLDAEQVRGKALIILEVLRRLGREIDSGDLSDLINVLPSDIEQALSNCNFVRPV